MTFTITRLQPSRYDLTVQWFTNGMAVPDATNATFHLAAADLPAGANEVRVEVSDPTTKVRTDPLQYLKDRRTWRVGSPTEPILEARRWEDKIVLSWPATPATFVLECRSNLKASTTWVPCEGSDPPVLVSNRFVVTNLVTSGAKFYRLRK